MNNRNKLLLAAAITSALLAFTRPASANTLVLDYGTHHSGVGGEFNAYSPFLNPMTMGYDSTATANVNGGPGFETFCIEYNEHFNPGNSYTYSISNAALLGGNGGPSDPLSQGTAWLYSNFAHNDSFGGFTSYNHTNTEAGLLQNAIWWLEGEHGLTYNSGNQFEAAVVSQFGSAANAMADNSPFGFGVGVLNLWVHPDYTGYAQDQLVLVPGVPDGGTTVLLLGLGLLGLFFVRGNLASRHAVAPVLTK